MAEFIADFMGIYIPAWYVLASLGAFTLILGIQSLTIGRLSKRLRLLGQHQDQLVATGPCSLATDK